MEFGEVLKWRRDVRHFSTESVSEELVAELIKAAQYAPSVGFSQPWRFVRVDSAEARGKIRASFEAANLAAGERYDTAGQSEYFRLKLAGLDRAPVQLAVFCDEDTGFGRGLGRQTMPECMEYSVVMAIYTLWLAAASLGLGVGWVSILNVEDVRQALDPPPSWRLIAYLCVGHPEQSSLEPELLREGWETRDPRASHVLVR
jgi:5,6-dimethylbenzimidazole synthase